MCQAKPQLRCEYHVIADLRKAEDSVLKAEKKIADLIARGQRVPDHLNNQLNRSREKLLMKKQDRLELLFHQYTNAKANLIAVKAGDAERDDYTVKAEQIVAEIDALRKTNPAYAKVIHQNSINRNNAGKYLRSGELPETNEEIVEFLELIDKERSVRTKNADGKTQTLHMPLNEEEQQLKQEAVELLKRGDNTPVWVKKREEVEAEQREQAEKERQEHLKAEELKAKQKQEAEKKKQQEQEAKQKQATTQPVTPNPVGEKQGQPAQGTDGEQKPTNGNPVSITATGETKTPVTPDRAGDTPQAETRAEREQRQAEKRKQARLAKQQAQHSHDTPHPPAKTTKQAVPKPAPTPKPQPPKQVTPPVLPPPPRLPALSEQERPKRDGGSKPVLPPRLPPKQTPRDFFARFKRKQ